MMCRLDEEKKAMDEQVKELTAKVFTVPTKSVIKLTEYLLGESLIL